MTDGSELPKDEELLKFIRALMEGSKVSTGQAGAKDTTHEMPPGSINIVTVLDSVKALYIEELQKKADHHKTLAKALQSLIESNKAQGIELERSEVAFKLLQHKIMTDIYETMLMTI